MVFYDKWKKSKKTVFIWLAMILIFEGYRNYDFSLLASEKQMAVVEDDKILVDEENPTLTVTPEIVLAEPEGETAGAIKYYDAEHDVYWFNTERVNIPLKIINVADNGETGKTLYTVMYSANKDFLDAQEVPVSADEANVFVTLATGETSYYFKITGKDGNTGKIQRITIGYDDTQPEIEKIEIKQLDADETKMAFAVTVADAETGIRKIQYRVEGEEIWQDVEYSENNGVYTFITKETYEDGCDYVWEVRVANHVTNDMANAAVTSVAVEKIDTIAPKLISVQIDGVDVVTDDAYIYNTAKEVMIRIEEQFFAKEDIPVYPNVKLFSRESGTSGFVLVEDVNVTWTDEGVGTVLLPLNIGEETEYQLTMTYKDSSGNSLTEDENLGVAEDGQFKSKIFVIDAAAPKFEISYDTASKNVVNEAGESSDTTIPLAEHTAYYNTDIDVTLTFYEKYYKVLENDALEYFEMVVTKDGSVIPIPEITWHHEENVHKATFKIEALDDHTNDGDYQFEVKYYDCAGNKMDVTDAADYDENSGDTGSYKSPVLVVDTIAPILTTSYEEKPAQTLEDGRDYFKTDTIFNIEVSDRSIRYQELKEVLKRMTAVNVDGDEIVDTQLKADIEEIVGKKVNHTNGGEEPKRWTLQLNLSTEANYEIPISYVDLAGNAAVVRFQTREETGSDVITEYGTEYTEEATVDKTLLEKNSFIKFIGDVRGEKVIDKKMLVDETTEEGGWISKIYQVVSNVWMKLWGNKEIKFEVYFRDEIAGIQTIEMQYLDDEKQAVRCKLTKDEEVKLIVDEEGIASADENGETYIVYSGSVVLDEDDELLVSSFEMTKVIDKATNVLENVVFASEMDAKILHLDNEAPKLIDVTFGGKTAVKEERYFNYKTTNVVLTIEERFFGKEDVPRYPSCTLITHNVITNEITEKEVITNGHWENLDNDRYALTVPLREAEGVEIEYQIVLNYEDPAGNLLVNGDGMSGVEDGVFTSKWLVIDRATPKLMDYSVTTTNCDVQGAAVLKNDTGEGKDDLVVNFTIDDNPEYFRKTDKHACSQDNLIVKLYKENKEFKTLSVKGEKLVDEKNAELGTVTIPEDGRNIECSFSYDGEEKTQDQFHVTILYKDVVEHAMADGRDTTDLINIVDKNGMYTSPTYIIDHVNPIFKIQYSDATNVVENNVDELKNRLHGVEDKVDSGKKPVVGYTAYYNKDIDVTLTFNEKYYNVDENGELEHFKFVITKNGEEVADTKKPGITWSHSGTKHTATFTIEALEDHSNDGDYQFTVKYQDCATNKMDASAAKSSNEESGTAGVYSSPILVMDTTTPVLKKVSYNTIDNFNTVKGRDYVNKETKMTFTMSEHNPTPTSNYSITSIGKLVAEWAGTENARKTTLETVPMRNSKGDEQTVTMTIVDWAGNKAVLKNENVLRSEINTTFKNGKFTDQFTVDTVVPKIQLEYVTYKPDRADVKGIDYFKQPIKVKVTVDEHNFDEDLFKQPVVKTDKDVVYKESEWKTNGDVHEKTFTFSKDNQYDLSIIGKDNAKNKLELNDASDMAEKLNKSKSKVSLSVAVDSTIPAIGDTVKPVIAIKPSSPQNETIDGQALYNTDVTYEVVVYDPLVNDYASGINDITFKVTGEDGTAATCKVNKQGGIENGAGVTVKRVGGDVADLACGVDNKYTFNVTISSATFNTNGIVLWVGANDVATTHNEKKVDPIAIDITAPKVVVSYDNNEVTNEKYFKDVRTATVTVTERNFSDDCLKFIVNDSDKELHFSLANAGSDNRDDAVWVAHYTFAADEDYTVDVEVQDRARNSGTVDDTGEAPQEFTIDMTIPKISVEYDNNSVLNELYYKEARTATITIEERNFSADDVVIELTAKDGGATINTPGVSSWSSDGDYHRATIHYNYDGEFTCDIDFMDLATNEADDYEMDHFIVDLTAPEIEIFDIEDRSANNDVVAPGIRYSDTNYDADGTVVEMVGYKNGLVEMTGSRVVTGNGVEFKLKDFERVPEMDDMYTMRAIVYDLAGNSSEATVMFSVNRFGSVYTFDAKTEALVGENGSYYTKMQQEIVVTETNVDTLKFREITLNLNGKLKTLVEKKDYEVVESDNEASWKQFTYQIAADNFAEEGLYILTIYSEDRATNVSDNNVKGKKIEFIVDKTDPSILITGVETEGDYTEESREVTIDVDDNVAVGHVEVTLNGETTKYSAVELAEMNGKIVLTIGSSNKYQYLKATVYDAAGNGPVSQEVVEFLITPNYLVQFYMNKPLFYGSIGTLVALGGFWWFLVGKKRKKDEEVY